jgi:excisionase family DNA binding protein
LTDDRTGGRGAVLATPQDSRGVALVAAIVAETLSQQAQQRPAVDAVQASVKMMLTIEEASLLSGIGRSAIDGAIRRGDLKAHRGLGRGRRLKRADLERWAAML